jgi:small subunit ribosomal protein S8
MDILQYMLISLKNAGNAGKPSIIVPHSAFKAAVAKALFENGYIASYEKRPRQKGGDVLLLGVKYKESGSPKISNVQRISKLSRRVYAGVKELRPVRQGHGHVFLSTPKGILSNVEAARQHVGGEMLFEIW